MSIKAWEDSKTKNLGAMDVGLVKLSVAGLILMLAKLWKPLLGLDWYWYAVIGLLAGIKPAIKFFRG